MGDERCPSGKHLFASPQAAWSVASRQTRAHRGAVLAYRCHLCRRWHVASGERSRPQRKRMKTRRA